MQEYEELLEEQESNVLRAFLNLDSPFEVPREFCHHKLNFTTPFAILEPSMLLVIMLTRKQLIMRGKLNVSIR